jgi:uncharacterized SAM-binding protein YcdF (DUF218 family)
MNEIVFALGLESWKPLLTALILPPVPFIVLVLAGARLMYKRRLLSWALILLGLAGVWLSCSIAVGQGMSFWLLQPPRALSESEIGDLKKAPKTAIIVLGGGRQLLAPEYGLSTLHPRSIERLRFGIWLSRETGLPVGYSGGVGFAARPGPSEAEIAGRVAEREFGRPLRWLEGESRDTRENALRTVAMLQPQGIEQIIVVTHGYHMPRAMADFQRAIGSARIKLIAAPLGVPVRGHLRVLDWMPSPEGMEDNWLVLHEFLGRLAGA